MSALFTITGARYLQWALTALLAATLTGCLPVVWAVPPTQFDIGAGAATGMTTGAPEAIIPIGIGAYPLAFALQHHERPFDVGLGYRGLLSFQGTSMHAPYLEATYMHRPHYDGFWTRATGRDLRTGLAARGKLFFGSHLESPRPAVGMRFFVEFVGFHDREGAHCDISNFTSWFCGYTRGYGERSWGLYAEAQRSISFADPYTGLYLGLFWRIHAGAGFGFVGGFN